MRQWTFDTIKQAPRQLIWIILAFLLGGSAGVVAFIKSVPAYWYLPVVTATLAFSLMAAYYFLQLRDRNRQGKSGVGEEALENTLTIWLINGGYSVKKSDSEDAYFTLTAKDAVNREFGVTRLKSDPDRISIWEGYTLSHDQLKAITLLPTDVYSEVAEDMRIDIAAFDIEVGTAALNHQSQSTENTPAYVNAFYLRDQAVFGHQFNVDEFYQRISFVKRATTVVSEYLRRMLRLADQYSGIQPTSDKPNDQT